MRIIGKFFLFVISALAFSSCFEPPQFSIVPVISGPVTLSFVDVPSDQSQDSLIVSFNFKDGDGDLGLSSTGDNIRAFANTYFYDLSGSIIDFGDSIPKKYFTYSVGPPENPTYIRDTLISFADKRLNSQYDTLPDFVPPYECTRWSVLTTSAGITTDTVYIRLNPNYYNMFIDIYVQQGDGTYALFDFTKEFEYPSCAPEGFNARFPILSSDLSHTTPLEGTIKYGILSGGWVLFYNKNIELHITIQDRAFHRSNTLTTGPIFIRPL